MYFFLHNCIWRWLQCYIEYIFAWPNAFEISAAPSNFQIWKDVFWDMIFERLCDAWHTPLLVRTKVDGLPHLWAPLASLIVTHYYDLPPLPTKMYLSPLLVEVLWENVWLIFFFHRLSTPERLGFTLKGDSLTRISPFYYYHCMSADCDSLAFDEIVLSLTWESLYV